MQKDVIAAGIGVIVLLVFLFVAYNLKGETIVETGFAFEGDSPKTFGNNPVGVIRLKQRLFDSWYLEYEHHSSVADEDDRNVYDSLGVTVHWIFGKRGCR